MPEGAPFLAVGGETISGPDLARRVAALVEGLRRAGFAHGDRLAIHLHRCIDEAVALLAAAAAGGLAVPVHPKLKDDQVRHILTDCEPWAVITSTTKGALMQAPEQVLAGQRIYTVEEPVRGAVSQPFAALLATGATLPSGPIDPHAPAILLYTSGSTGLAKAVVQTHHNLALGASLVADYLGLTAADHILAVLPFSFDYGLNQLLSAMHAQCRITAADFLGIGELRECLRTVRPTGLAGVPSLWHEVARGLEAGSLTSEDGASLRYVTNSGGRLALSSIEALRRHWPRTAVFAMYGLTEAFRSAYLDPRELAQHPDSFGRALRSVELLLVDPDTGAVLDGPATGELVHAGALVARGYWRRPEAERERFRSDPRGTGGVVVYSGDLVRRDAEGRHYFVARRDRMLKVAGHRISPDEVAHALHGLPGIGEVAVFGVDGGDAGHRIVLCAQGDPADVDLKARILRQCRARLPAYMVPAVVHVLAALPHNKNGKVDVPALERSHR